MHCKACGKSIADDSRYCQHCGSAQFESESEHLHEGSAESLENVPEETAEIEAAPDRTGLLIALVAGALLLVFIIATLGGHQPATSPVTDAQADQAVTDAEAAADAALKAADAAQKNADEVLGTLGDAPKSSEPWSYSTDVDKVRGGTSYFASTTSTNSIYQDAPYDSQTTLRMTVRQSPAHGDDVLLTLSSGQLMCPSYDGCYGTVKFDDKPAHRVNFNGASDNSSDVIFVESSSSFIRDLKQSKSAVVEIEVYQAGRPQFEFNVAGLKWEH